MTSNIPSKRPNCKEIYEKRRLWALHENEFEKDLKVVFDSTLKKDNCFIYHILESNSTAILKKHIL
jgi:hypothetical protein